MNAYEKIRECIYHPNVAKEDQALAALSELERAAAEPVAWMWEDMLGISHTYVSSKRPTWPDAGASPEMAVAINVRPLYTAPPAPVAEIRAAVVTDELGKKVYEKWIRLPRRIDCSFAVSHGIDMIAAVRAELGPALGLVELKEPTPEECERILDIWVCGSGENVDAGRAMFDACRAVMWPKEGL